ncbi:heat shock protein HSP20/alpha crystallin family, partial [Striga asiatica]
SRAVTVTFTVHWTTANVLAVTVKTAVLLVVPPPLRRAALLFMAELPIQRLARARAVVHGTANRAPPELVRPRLGPPAARVRAQAEARAQPVLGPTGEPTREEPVGSVGLRLRHVAAEIAEEGAAASSGGRLSVVVTGEPGAGDDGGGVGDEDESELAGVGLDQEAAALGDVPADAIPVLEAVAEFPEGVDVSEEGGAGAEGDAGAEVLVVLGAATSVELDDGERVEGRRVRCNRGLGHQGCAAPSVLQAVESNLFRLEKKNTNHAKSVTSLDAAGIGTEFEESVSRLGPVDEISGAAGGGAEFAENTEDDIVRQGFEQITPSTVFRRGPHPFPASGLFSGGRRRLPPTIIHGTHVGQSRIA